MIEVNISYIMFTNSESVSLFVALVRFAVFCGVFLFSVHEPTAATASFYFKHKVIICSNKHLTALLVLRFSFLAFLTVMLCFFRHATVKKSMVSVNISFWFLYNALLLQIFGGHLAFCFS